MGVDYDAELIVGFSLDEDKIKQWMDKHNIDDYSDIDKVLKTKFPEIPEKVLIHPGQLYSGSLSLYVVRYGNEYSGENNYYLSFYRCATDIKGIKAITENHLNLAKKVYKELTDDDLKCDSVDDVEVFPVLYIW